MRSAHERAPSCDRGQASAGRERAFIQGSPPLQVGPRILQVTTDRIPRAPATDDGTSRGPEQDRGESVVKTETDKARAAVDWMAAPYRGGRVRMQRAGRSAAPPWGAALGEEGDLDGFLAIEQVEGVLAAAMRITGMEAGRGYAQVYGHALPGDASGFERAAERAESRGWGLKVVDAGRGRVVVLLDPLPRGIEADRHRGWNVILLLLTLATTTWAGALHRGVDLLSEPGRWATGLPYSLALLAILGVHELGHYFVARRHRISVSLPFFIPAPFYLGTFGAFISMSTAVRSRGAYFDVGVAGPLAGLVVAVLAVLVGVSPYGVVGVHGMRPDSSFLFYMLYRLAGGPPGHAAVQLGPIAFAGWLGLIVTAMNLLPVGQLDGGHIAYALLGGRRARTLGAIVIGVLVAAGILYSPHWLMWALIVWALAGLDHPPARNELRPLTRGRRVLAWGTLAILLTIVLPFPG